MAQTHYISIVNSKGTATDDDTSANVSVAGVTDANLMHIVEDYVVQAGVVDRDNDCVVTQQAVADMTVLCSAGTAYVVSSTWTQNSNAIRFYRDVCTVGATGSELTITANSSGSTRYDLICVKVDTTVIGAGTVDDTGSNVCSYVVVTGTPGATIAATIAAMPADHLLLALVTVVDSETEITSAEITDYRVQALIDGSMITDWIPAGHTFTRTGNYTFTVPKDWTSRYRAGTRIKYTDTAGDDYGVVISSSFGSGVTTVTMATNNDYAMAAGAITLPYYSYCPSPNGYPGWFDYTPVYGGIGSLAFTVTTDRVHQFSINGNVCNLEIVVIGTTSGTDGTSIGVTVPVAMYPNNAGYHGSGTNTYGHAGGTYKSGIWYNTTSTQVGISAYDYSNWGLGAGRAFFLALGYRIA